MSQNLDPRLLEYKTKAKPIYLDGRYFNIILGSSPEVSTKPIVIKLKNGGTTTNLEQIYVDITKSYMLFRVIIEVYEEIIVHNQKKDRLYTRHSNLLIFDNIENIITRFEPLEENAYNQNIDNEIIEHFRYGLPQHQYVNLDVHPQKPDNMGLCVAYVIKFAYFYLMRNPVEFDDNENDIIRFSLYINELYSDRLTGRPDIEFGYNPVFEGAAVGGLSAGLIGGLVGGPSAALAGFGLGAIGGASIVALSDSDRRNYPRNHYHNRDHHRRDHYRSDYHNRDYYRR